MKFFYALQSDGKTPLSHTLSSHRFTTEAARSSWVDAGEHRKIYDPYWLPALEHSAMVWVVADQDKGEDRADAAAFAVAHSAWVAECRAAQLPQQQKAGRGQLWEPCPLRGCDNEPVCLGCGLCLERHCGCDDGPAFNPGSADQAPYGGPHE